MSMTGTCLCGAVRITIDGAHDPRPGACHCRMCQRWTGGVFLCFEAAANAVTVEGNVMRYSSSDFAERAFCPHCGTHLWMRNTDATAPAYELMPGLFEDILSAPLRSEIYTDSAMASIALGGDHPRATAAQYKAKNRTVDGDPR